MEQKRFSTEIVGRQLATLEPTIEALLKCNAPRSPIIKEKIQQAEDIIINIPLELEAMAKSWHMKLANWWVNLAMQQIPLLLPMEEELKMITVPPSPISGFRPIKDSIALSKYSKFNVHSVAASKSPRESSKSPRKRSKPENKASPISKKGQLPSLKDNSTEASKAPKAPPSTCNSNDQPTTIPQSMPNTSQVEDNIEKGSAPEELKVAPPPTTTTSAVAVVSERKSSFKPLPAGLDWVSPMTEAPITRPQATPNNSSAKLQKPKETAVAANYGDHQAASAISVPEFEPTAFQENPPVSKGFDQNDIANHEQTETLEEVEPVPNDFNWGSTPANKKPKPNRTDVKKMRTHVPGVPYNWE